MAIPWNATTNTLAEFKRLRAIEAKTTDGTIDGSLYNNFTARTKKLSFTFQSTEQEANYDLIVQHNENAFTAIPQWFDPDGKQQEASSIFKLDVTDPKNKFTISFGTSLAAGKHLLVLEFFYI